MKAWNPWKVTKGELIIGLVLVACIAVGALTGCATARQEPLELAEVGGITEHDLVRIGVYCLNPEDAAELAPLVGADMFAGLAAHATTCTAAPPPPDPAALVGSAVDHMSGPYFDGRGEVDVWRVRVLGRTVYAVLVRAGYGNKARERGGTML